MTTRKNRDHCCLIVLAIVLVLARESSGQGLSPFKELGTQVSAEDRIIVTATDGRPVKGRLVSVSDTALRLATHGTVQEFRAADVERVDRVRPDGLKNGALWGLAAGIGTAFLAPPLFNDFVKLDDADTATVLALFVLPGAGAAAGILIDKSITDSVPIYVRRRVALRVAFGTAERASGASVGVKVSF
jgi:hypothetical protein